MCVLCHVIFRFIQNYKPCPLFSKLETLSVNHTQRRCQRNALTQVGSNQCLD